MHYTCVQPAPDLQTIQHLEKLQEQIVSQQDELQKEISQYKENEILLIKQLDSLTKIKSQTKIKYVQKLQSVDTLPPNLLSKQFSLLFAKFDIK